ncbi:hypothetical protein PC129_g4149 [Phytophthora cactorum]|uniref:Gamma tubulin complex component C-terminal domain-containing protein n=2 Tax=Phytophthora cactorum TaxID=29920 RepID=A0A8T1EAE0_9STRA|nr:hypothetical protein Pcac1_g25535 [Phytophthora cactorum]KAG2836760.1 hypothetical protein PC111_g4887 [Phytophthora cactorum]KAG2838915.1 hypothetical protein PC112_g4330 [Phytophthora cactorum]KAG2919673.1 hypothetical protein PC114_g6399 [Phytophthora cactorum]KAG2937986.1 hypothetical protein PC115_g3948 [Phytophthora cactorum]
MTMAAEAEAGVVELLRRLRSHICCGSRSEFRRVLPVYQRLLSPREDAVVSVQNELLEIRAKLLACGQDADVGDIVGRMDRVVERCMSIEQQQQQSTEAAVPMDGVMRLLVALAGGEDGDTFVLEDPMQTTNDKSSMIFAAEKRRVGDRIRTNGIEMVQRSKALFHKAPVSLQEEALFSQDLFSDFGNGISSRRTSLWCSDNTVPQYTGLLAMMPFKQPNRFFGLPGNQNDVDQVLTQIDTPKRQRHGQASTDAIKTLKTEKPGKQPKRLSPRKEVFFYDGTQEVHCKGQTLQADWGDASSITENSSWGSECSLDSIEPWIAGTYAWEDLGDRVGLPESYAKPLVRERKRSVRDLAIPADFALNGEIPLEIYEEDLIEDSLRALSGVDSTLFRRDFQSATFQLPGMRRVKLPNTTVSATMSVLEVFRKAGTMVMRLELLAIYYSQDPARGGKTLQAMGDALQVYLSTHRALVETIAQQCLASCSSEVDHDVEIISVTKLLCKTRKVCRVIETIGAIFGCDVDLFWPLLQHGKFPRGVALINRLHHYASSLRVEDSSGRMQELVIWFLVKSCSPLLAVLSDLISSGRLDEATDPFDEFEATMWSRNLLDKATTGCGCGLFSEELSTEATKMFPTFLVGIAPMIVHLSQVQALLRSANAIAYTHPLVNMQSLNMLTRGDKAAEHAEEWKAIVEAIAFTGDVHDSDGAEGYKNVPAGISAAAAPAEESRRDFMREDAEAKRSSQLQQQNMLDQQVLEQKQHSLQLEQQEQVDDAKRIDEEEKALADREAHGREVLLNKYSALMNGAEERHDYMKWRRDRAVRLSTAKEQLQRVRVDDMATWTADKEKRSNESTTLSDGGVVDIMVENNGENAESVVGISTSGVASTLASTSEWRASVKVNKEAGSRTTATTDDGTWRSSVKVNKEAGVRRSVSDTDGIWRASVKVNKEAGRRSSGILNDPAFTEGGSRNTGIRILNEPGGSGAGMYGTLYGQRDEPPEEHIQVGIDVESAAACAIDDAKMEGSNSVVDQTKPMGDTTLIMTPREEVRDVEMDYAIHEEEEPTNQRNRGEELSSETSEVASVAAEPAEFIRLSLPPVHPFFSATTCISREDFELLSQALTETISETEFTSFKSIVDCCVETPVRLIAEKLEQVAVDWFRNSLQLLDHLRWLRKLMLMSEGLCMDIFARDFLQGLDSTTRVNWGVEGRLSSALTLAMIEGSVTLDAVSQTFHYNTTAALSQMLDSLTMRPAVSSLLNEIELMYDVKWPLGFVITTQSLNYYKKMHQFLLHVRLTSLEMREAWGMLRTIRAQGQLSPSLERLCGGVVYKMQAFLRAFNETFATKVLMMAWSELEHAVQKATKLVELRRCHEEYVSVAIRCCFLDRPALAIRSAFLDTLAAAWSLTAFVRALERQVTGRISEETRIRTLCYEFDVALRVLIGSLQSVTLDTERNTRQFSECLLLRLNFNQYYSASPVTAEAGAAGERVSAVVEF